MNNIITILILLISSCQQPEIKEETPECIGQKIQEYKYNQTSCESGKSVYRYILNHRYVFVFNPGDCGADMMADIYDENCVRLCGLGGITGNLICEDVKFWEKANDETLIWED